MSNELFCQSCGMPLEKAELLGTEKDGSKSHEYCTYCYREGAFVNPGMNLSDMSTLVKTKMEEMKMDHGIINMAVSNLPNLKRWKVKLI